MKKLLLIITAIAFIGCSDDDAQPTIDPMDGLSITREFKDCVEENECYINYRVKNESEHFKHFFIKYTFDDIDSHYESDVYLSETLTDPNESSIRQIYIDETNEVQSVEIVDAEIID